MVPTPPRPSRRPSWPPGHSDHVSDLDSGRRQRYGNRPRRRELAASTTTTTSTPPSSPPIMTVMFVSSLLALLRTSSYSCGSYDSQSFGFGVKAQEQNGTASSSSSSGSTPADPTVCASPLANGGMYTVSKPADIATLSAALAGCRGGEFNVTWKGVVALSEPLVVAPGSSLTITGVSSAAGDDATLDGNNATGLVDLNVGSSLSLAGVTLQNARRNSGNGGAVSAEANECVFTAKDSRFTFNNAASSVFGEGRGGVLALGPASTAKLENCTLVGNRAEGLGGGVSTLGDSSVLFERCSFDQNEAAYSGGAVAVDGRSAITFAGSNVSNNVAQEDGGAVYGINSTVVISGESLFLNNTAYGRGGAISLYHDCTLNITGSTLRSNNVLTGASSSNNWFETGGAVRVQGNAPASTANIRIMDSVLEENIAPSGGALYAMSGYKLLVERSSFANNEAWTLFGGGVEISGSAGEARFVGCNFTGGFAWNGGGALAADDCTATFSGCRFEANTGLFDAGALRLDIGAVVDIDGSYFLSNRINIETQGSTGGAGAGIRAINSTLRVRDTVFEGNQAGYDTTKAVDGSELYGGGAAWMSSASNASFDGCSFIGNGGGVGGALLFSGSSFANITNAIFHLNTAARYGGAIAALDGSSFELSEADVSKNNATLIGGAVYLNAAVGRVKAVEFDGNAVTEGSGGAIAAFSSSNATITGGDFTLNHAMEDGGHLLASGAYTIVAVVGPLLVAKGSAGRDGGAVHVMDSATLKLDGVKLSGNRAERDGGAISAIDGLQVSMTDCDVTGNTCGRGGGGVSLESTDFIGTSLNFTDNVADAEGGGLRGFTSPIVQLRQCIFYTNRGLLGGAISGYQMDLVATFCDITENFASTDGGGLRLSYKSSAMMYGGNVARNEATYDGGGVALDASSDAYDDTLRDAYAPSTFHCEGGTTFDSNRASERGGAFYVTRHSSVLWDPCSSTGNKASLGASFYASHAKIELLSGSILAYGEVGTGAMVYGLDSDLEANGASFLSKGVPAVIAVQMNEGGTIKAFGCQFSGWQGPQVVLTEGALEMDSCDFRGSPANLLVSANDPATPARIRNTALGEAMYAGLASEDVESFGENVETCADDPCGTTEAFVASATDDDSSGGSHGGVRSCVDGDLGVYCPCFVATVTGVKECLQPTTTVVLEGPSEQLLAIGTDGTITSQLNVTAGTEGGMVVWRVEPVENLFSQEGLTWEIVPDVGILEPGGNTSVSIKGQLDGDLNGLTLSQFRAVNLGSGEFSHAMVNTTFYFCREGAFYNGTACVPCTDIPLSEGLECDERGVLLSTLPLAGGYWRANKNTTTIRECPHEPACEGGSVVTTANDYCSNGYQGPYCAVCTAGYAGGIAHRCHRCSSSFKAGMYTLAAIAAAAVVAFAYLLFLHLVRDPSEGGHLLSCFNNNGCLVSAVKKIPLHKLKIPIVVFQIVTQYTDITAAAYPPTFAKFLAYLDVFNMDLGWIFSASCVLNLDFYGRLLFTTLAPLAMLAALSSSYCIARNRVVRGSRLPKTNGGSGVSCTGFGGSNMSESRQLSVVKTKHMAVFMTMTFLVYSTVSTIVFQTFECDRLAELDRSFLRADYSLHCHTARHTSYMVYSGVMILIYPIGIPTLYAWLLFTHRHRIYPKQALRDGVSAERRLTDKKIAHTVLLWEAYVPHLYYFEVVECARRLLLTGCLVFILPDSTGQIAVACVLSVVSVCLFIMLRPYADANDDRTYIFGCIVVFLTMFMSLVETVQVAHVHSQSERVLSWLLIVLSLSLLASAVAECFLEVRTLTRVRTRTDPRASLLTVNPMRKAGDGDNRSDSSAYKGSFPDTGTERVKVNSASSELDDFITTVNFSGDGANGAEISTINRKHAVGTTPVPRDKTHHGNGSISHNSGNSRKNGSKQHVASGSSAASGGAVGGLGRVSGFAVMDDSYNANGDRPSRMADAGTSNDSTTNTYGPLTVDENQATLFPWSHPADDDLDSLDSPGIAEERFARRLQGGGGHRRGSAWGSLVPAMPEGSGGDDPCDHGVVVREAVLPNLRPAGPETNAFPMPDSSGVDDEEVAVLNGGHRGVGGSDREDGGTAPTTTAHVQRYLLQAASAAYLLGEAGNAETGLAASLKKGTRRITVAPGLEEKSEDGNGDTDGFGAGDHRWRDLTNAKLKM